MGTRAAMWSVLEPEFTSNWDLPEYQRYFNYKRDDFEHIKEIVHQNGGMNGGIDLERRKKDGLLVIKKTLLAECTLEDDRKRLKHKNFKPKGQARGSAWSEVTLAAHLRSYSNPHINQIIAYIQEWEENTNETCRYLYVKYCDLGSLNELIDFYKDLQMTIPEEFIWQVFRSVASALASMHTGVSERHGVEYDGDPQNTFNYIGHFDIKPDNVFLTHWPNRPYPLVILGDFGGAVTKTMKNQQEKEWQGHRGALTKTEAFLPPEEDYSWGSRATDIFCLGATMLRLIGTVPKYINQSVKIREPGQVDLIRHSPYSKDLQRIIRSSLDFDQGTRIRAVQLVYEIDNTVKRLVSIGNLTEFDVVGTYSGPGLRADYYDQAKFRHRQPPKALNYDLPKGKSNARSATRTTSGAQLERRNAHEDRRQRLDTITEGQQGQHANQNMVLGQGGVYQAARGMPGRPNNLAPNSHPGGVNESSQSSSSGATRRPDMRTSQTPANANQEWPTLSPNAIHVERKYVQ